MDPIPLPDLVVCKICERQVSAKWLYAHSTLCKDAAELKELVLKQQSKLSQIVNKAYDLRNQLNTNFALQKLKMSRRPSNELDDSFELQRMPSSPAYIKKNKKYLHFNFVAEQSEGGRCGSQTPSPDKSRRTKVGFSRRGSNEKLQEYEEEVNRAVGVLKSIIQYGNSAKLETIDVERDIANDFKIKNEVNVLYVAIKDKMISDYLQQFIENIQKYIKGKQTYLRKLEEVERQEYHTSSLKASDESFSSDNTRLQDLPTPFSLKAFKITSLDDSDVSEVCFERKNRLPDTRWMRRGSAGHPTPLKGPQVVTTESGPRRNFTTLSKFASPLLRQGSNVSQGSPQASPKSAGAMLNSKQKKGKIPQKLLDELIAMKEFHLLRKPSRLLSSRLNLKGKTSADSDGGKKKDLKRNQTIHINPGNTSADCKTLAHIADDPAEESKAGTDAVKIYEMWKKRQSWNYVAKDIDIKKLLNKADALEVCQEEEPPSGVDNNEALDREKQEENLLSKGDLTSSDESSSDDSSEANEEDDEEIEDSDDEFPTVPMRGYYSDSEVTNVRKGEQYKKTDVTIDDFNILKLLGEGAYGKVYLVKKKATGDMYAMKIVNFQDRESTHNKIASLRAESDVYKSITGDWVVKAYYTFSYESYVCFVMEYMLGGDLVGLLEQVGCFEESTAQFYFGELVLAVESLHCLGIVHRDLKPDNVLIDSTGHIKLTDFGLSEKGVVKLRQRTSTIRNSTLSSLTRNNSLHDSSEKIYNTITKELLSQLREDGGIGRKNSGEQAVLDPDLIPSPLTLRRIASTISELSPFHSEPYLVKNKNEEEVIFTFLDNQERNESWIPKKKIVKSSEHSNASNRKKELNRIIGTPDYMAPEIIKGSDCSDRSVDLWSLGVILYEFLVGVPPFNDDSMEKIFDNIVNLRFEWPSVGYEEDCITPEAADLIKKLMNPDPKKRITLSEVKKHAFFKNFEWDKVKSHQAPVIPMKKEVDCHTPMGLHTIFMEKMSEEMMREKRRKGIINEDVSDFQMKRIDLLHQLNQSLYHAHILSKGNTVEKAP